MTSMVDSQPMRESPPGGAETVSPVTAREAIEAAYPDKRLLVIKHVSSRPGISWYRANWYGNNENGLFIERSLFLTLRPTPDGISVEDQTVIPRQRFRYQ